MIYMGIDPGSIIAGWGIIESAAMNYGAIEWGHTKPPSKLSGKAGLPKRLKYIHDEIRDVVIEHQPEVVAIEHGFVGLNPHTALVMGKTLGAILVAVQNHVASSYPGPRIIEYAPKEIKLAVTGHGGASKELVRDMIISILQWPVSEMKLTYDESDALAVALTCAMREN